MTSSFNDDNVDSAAPTSAGTGPSDETEIVPPPTEGAVGCPRLR
jgi:hypothetical protein